MVAERPEEGTGQASGTTTTIATMRQPHGPTAHRPKSWPTARPRRDQTPDHHRPAGQRQQSPHGRRLCRLRPSTITRTAARDPEFAAQLARTEGNAETEALSLIRKAAHKECYWRAAAWLLERKNPADFAARKPDVMTPEQLRRMLASLATLILQDLSEEKLDQVLDASRPGPPRRGRMARRMPRVAGRVPLAFRQCSPVTPTRVFAPLWVPLASHQCSLVTSTRRNSTSDRRVNEKHESTGETPVPPSQTLVPPSQGATGYPLTRRDFCNSPHDGARRPERMTIVGSRSKTMACINDIRRNGNQQGNMRCKSHCIPNCSGRVPLSAAVVPSIFTAFPHFPFLSTCFRIVLIPFGRGGRGEGEGDRINKTPQFSRKWPSP